ncbi:hypothetical protein A2U01_0084131, partial [Trifolium medium]|nr:hypothetical protein [Trifolium medium]
GNRMKVNIPPKKLMILPHKVKQAAKHAYASVVESLLDDDATTPWQWHVGKQEEW